MEDAIVQLGLYGLVFFGGHKLKWVFHLWRCNQKMSQMFAHITPRLCPNRR